MNASFAQLLLDESRRRFAAAFVAAMQYRVKPSDPMAASELGRALSIAPALAQVLLHRGLSDAAQAREFLLPALAGLTAPDAMADRAMAADRLASAIRRRERIAVFGDYDVDGTTSAAILAGILEQLGGIVHVAVGNRWDGGYGLSDIALDRLLQSAPRVLVTTDCGSSDHERIARARSLGVDVIVVDHHLVPAEPLPAFAFLNPHRPECGFGYKGLASAGLVLSLGAAVRAVLGIKIDLREWLDLVALGTIADVAPLDGDNRRLVRAGLARLGAEHARPGVIALRELARLRRDVPISSVDVGFKLTPRLNAAGRMGDPALTLALLRSTDITQARQLAARIEQCNDERKETERRVTEQAFAQVEAIYGAAPSCGVVLAGSDFHKGVVGITAARVVDRYGVPAVVVAFDGEHGANGERADTAVRARRPAFRSTTPWRAARARWSASGAIRRRQAVRFRGGDWTSSASRSRVRASRSRVAPAQMRSARWPTSRWTRASSSCRRPRISDGSSRSERRTRSRYSCCPRCVWSSVAWSKART